METIKAKLSFLEPNLIGEILSISTVVEVEKGMELIKEEQYIKSLPLVINGIIKVYSRFDDRELLLYYLEANESCIMSFSACIHNTPSKIFAKAETKSTLLLLPANKIAGWIKTYPLFNSLFYAQYDLRYSDLLHTLQEVIINKIDQRTYDFLVEKTKILKSEYIKESHSMIADELGTVREVITRALKKLESEGKIIQTKEGIKIIRL